MLLRIKAIAMTDKRAPETSHDGWRRTRKVRPSFVLMTSWTTVCSLVTALHTLRLGGSPVPAVTPGANARLRKWSIFCSRSTPIRPLLLRFSGAHRAGESLPACCFERAHSAEVSGIHRQPERTEGVSNANRQSLGPRLDADHIPVPGNGGLCGLCNQYVTIRADGDGDIHYPISRLGL